MYSDKNKKSIANREYYLRHRTEILKRRKEWRKTHSSDYYAINREKMREYHRKYYQSHKEYFRKKAAVYRQTPAGRQSALQRLYRFIDCHPFYNLEFLERLVRLNERTFSLDMDRGEVNLYAFIAAGTGRLEDAITTA